MRSRRRGKRGSMGPDAAAKRRLFVAGLVILAVGLGSSAWARTLHPWDGASGDRDLDPAEVTGLWRQAMIVASIAVVGVGAMIALMARGLAHVSGFVCVVIGQAWAIVAAAQGDGGGVNIGSAFLLVVVGIVMLAFARTRVYAPGVIVGAGLFLPTQAWLASFFVHRSAV